MRPGNKQCGYEVASGVLEPAERCAAKVIEQFAAVHFAVFLKVIKNGDKRGMSVIDAGGVALLLHQFERIHGGGDGGEILGLQETFGKVGLDVLGRFLEAIKDVGRHLLDLRLAGGEELRYRVRRRHAVCRERRSSP